MENWQQLTALIDGLDIGRGKAPDWSFRGQADARWSLQPSILRLLDGNDLSYAQAHGIERGVYMEFAGAARLHFQSGTLPEGDDPSMAWWMLMQHHSCPTRLLDWSQSPFVATYYAVESCLDADGAVWIVPSSPLNTCADQQHGSLRTKPDGDFFSDHPESVVYPILGTRHTARSLAQQGVYTISLDILADHAPVIEQLLDGSSWNQHFVKLVIPGGLKPELLSRLRTMNLTAGSLFPGPDGLGRAAREYVRIRVWDYLEDAT